MSFDEANLEYYGQAMLRNKAFPLSDSNIHDEELYFHWKELGNKNWSLITDMAV